MYLESADGRFRGVGYFESASQEPAFNPFYIVALIDPERRLLLVGQFPVHGIPELAPFLQDPFAGLDANMPDYAERNSSARATYEAMVSDGLAYIGDPAAYADTDLGAFVRSVHGMVASATFE
jgi:hypothetical protein